MKRELVSPKYILTAAVVFVWSVVLMPWSVFVTSGSDTPTVFFVQFSIFELQVFPTGEPPAHFFAVWTAYSANVDSGFDIATSYLIWMIGTGLLISAVVLTILLFVSEDRVVSILPIHPARVLGGMLLGCFSLFSVSAYLYINYGVADTPIPVGMFFMFVFGIALLINPLEDDSETIEDTEETPK